MSDPVKNFGRVTVSTGYDASATSIVLSGSEGAKLPQPTTDGPFNLVWYNSTDYLNPTDDPNREIVRCTARSTDNLTVTRGQEGITATTKNTSAKTYKMILALTKLTYDELVPRRWHQAHARTSPLQQIESMDSGWSDWYSTGTVSHDSSVYKTGSASVKIVNASNNVNAGVRKNITDADWSGSSFRFWCRSDAWGNVTNAEVLVSTLSSFTQYFSFNLKDFLVSPPDGEWIEIVLTKTNFSNATGSADWKTVDDMIVRSKATNATTPTVWFDGFERYAAPSDGVISISFDDGWDSAYTQGKLKMDAYGFRGTLYSIWNEVGQTNYLTQAQVDSMASDGWDISGHGDTNLTTLTTTQIEYDLSKMRAYLDERGYKGSDNYALPNGDYTDAVLAQVYKYFGTARNIDGLRQTAGVYGRRLNAYSVSNVTSTATLQAIVDNAIANNDWAIITFHKVVTTASVDTEYSIANFGTFIDYLNTSGVSVLPVSEVIKNGAQMRTVPRYVTVTQSATPAINTDKTDVASITALAQAITSMTTNLTGNPAPGENLIVEITDNGTARAITWGTSFEASGTVALPTTTVLSVKLTVAFKWNASTNKWRCLGVS